MNARLILTIAVVCLVLVLLSALAARLIIGLPAWLSDYWNSGG